jgi:peroxiredoxin
MRAHEQILENLRKRHMGKKVAINTPAPDFELKDFNGRTIRLSDFRGEKHLLLVFNRGFA